MKKKFTSLLLSLCLIVPFAIALLSACNDKSCNVTATGTLGDGVTCAWTLDSPYGGTKGSEITDFHLIFDAGVQFDGLKVSMGDTELTPSKYTTLDDQPIERNENLCVKRKIYFYFTPSGDTTINIDASQCKRANVSIAFDSKMGNVEYRYTTKTLGYEEAIIDIENDPNVSAKKSLVNGFATVPMGSIAFFYIDQKFINDEIYLNYTKTDGSKVLLNMYSDMVGRGGISGGKVTYVLDTAVSIRDNSGLNVHCSASSLTGLPFEGETAILTGYQPKVMSIKSLKRNGADVLGNYLLLNDDATRILVDGNNVIQNREVTIDGETFKETNISAMGGVNLYMYIGNDIATDPHKNSWGDTNGLLGSNDNGKLEKAIFTKVAIELNENNIANADAYEFYLHAEGNKLIKIEPKVVADKKYIVLDKSKINALSIDENGTKTGMALFEVRMKDDAKSDYESNHIGIENNKFADVYLGTKNNNGQEEYTRQDHSALMDYSDRTFVRYYDVNQLFEQSDGARKENATLVAQVKIPTSENAVYKSFDITLSKVNDPSFKLTKHVDVEFGDQQSGVYEKQQYDVDMLDGANAEKATKENLCGKFTVLITFNKFEFSFKTPTKINLDLLDIGNSTIYYYVGESISLDTTKYKPITMQNKDELNITLTGKQQLWLLVEMSQRNCSIYGLKEGDDLATEKVHLSADFSNLYVVCASDPEHLSSGSLHSGGLRPSQNNGEFTAFQFACAYMGRCTIDTTGMTLYLQVE